jgi:steroid delta-isomerase-like uncharacterized protein
MSAKGAAVLVRQHVQHIVNEQQLDVVEQVYHSDLIFHDPFAPGGAARGHDGLKGFLQAIFAAIPDFHFAALDYFENGQLAGWHGNVSGTLQHDLASLSGHGQRFEVPISEVFRIRDGKVAEVWVYIENGTLVNQVSSHG